MTGDVHTCKPLEGTETISNAWGVYLHDANTEAAELVAATFGEHAQKRAELFVAALELSRKIGERNDPSLDSQPDFRCAVERKPVKAQSGQNEKCVKQCEHCRASEHTVLFGGAEFVHETGAPDATRS